MNNNNSSSSSSFEELNGSSMEVISSEGSGHSSPTVVTSSQLPVDGDVWKYMSRLEKYSSSLERVKNDCRVTVDLQEAATSVANAYLLLTGDDKAEVDKAVEEIEKLIKHCLQSVTVRHLPTQADSVYQKVTERVNEVSDQGAMVSLKGNGHITVVGSNVEMEDALTKLRQLDVNADTGATAAASASSVDSSSNRPLIINVEKDLWQYMRTNDEYSEDVRKLKENMHVEMIEVTDDGDLDGSKEIQLEFAGATDDVKAASDKALLLISRCRGLTVTKTVPCPDNRLFSRVVKFLPKVKLSAYVSAADGQITITGTDEEQDVCREKLTKMGLVFEDDDIPPGPELQEGKAPETAFSIDEVPAEVVSERLDVTRQFDRSSLQHLSQTSGMVSDFLPSFSEDVQPRETVSTMSVSSGRRPVDPPTAFYQTTHSDVVQTEGATTTEFPVPIESPLWMFMDQRRHHQLQELREVYGVNVRTYPADEGFVGLRLEATDPDMLSCGLDALSNLIDQLNRSIVITALDVQTELPREIGALFQQLSQETDAVAVVSGSKIVIIGTNDGAAECQQRIVEFFQQSQQMMSNPEMMAEMQQRMSMAARGGGIGGGLGGRDSETMSRNMFNQMLTGSMGPPRSNMAGMLPGALTGMMNGGPIGGAGGMTGRGLRPGLSRGPPMDSFGGMTGQRFRMPMMSGPPERMMGGNQGGPTNMRGGVSMSAPSSYVHAPDIGTRGMTMDGSRGQSAGEYVSMPTNAATHLVSGKAEGMVGDLATTPGSVLMGSQQNEQNEQQPKKKKPMLPPRMMTNEEEAAMMQGQFPAPRTTQDAGESEESRDLDSETQQQLLQQQQQQQKEEQQKQTTKTKNQATSNYEKQKSPKTKSTRDEKINPELSESCTACEAGGWNASRASRKCPHAFCVSCVRSYFSHGERECPVCGVKDESAGSRCLTQPVSGHMLTTYDNRFKLPGFEPTSRGTIVVNYSFPAGTQSDDMSSPGRRYAATTKTAFFPMSTEGQRVVELLHHAFDARLLFTVQPSTNNGDDELVWNGVCHKTSVFGGPQQSGYPDAVYMRRVLSELANKGFH